jgi:hypothetical protein
MSTIEGPLPNQEMCSEIYDSNNNKDTQHDKHVSPPPTYKDALLCVTQLFILLLRHLNSWMIHLISIKGTQLTAVKIVKMQTKTSDYLQYCV